MLKIIFDFDGTIIDIGEKYKYVFGLITGLDSDSQKIFWESRKSGIKSAEILKLFPNLEFSAEEFLEKWRRVIESNDALKLDTVSPRIYEALEVMLGRKELILCTARQDEVQLLQQLQELALDKYFSSVLVTKQMNSKLDVIGEYASRDGLSFTESDWIIGDTPEDVLTGQELGIKTCGVLSGLTPESYFRNLDPPPNMLTADVATFLFHIN